MLTVTSLNHQAAQASKLFPWSYIVAESLLCKLAFVDASVRVKHKVFWICYTVRKNMKGCLPFSFLGREKEGKKKKKDHFMPADGYSSLLCKCTAWKVE